MVDYLILAVNSYTQCRHQTVYLCICKGLTARYRGQELRNCITAWSSRNSRANKPAQNSSSLTFFERNVQDIGKVVSVSEPSCMYIRLVKLLIKNLRSLDIVSTILVTGVIGYQVTTIANSTIEEHLCPFPPTILLDLAGGHANFDSLLEYPVVEHIALVLIGLLVACSISCERALAARVV